MGVYVCVPSARCLRLLELQVMGRPYILVLDSYLTKGVGNFPERHPEL